MRQPKTTFYKPIKIGILSKRIKISQEEIIRILSSNGFIIPRNNPNFYLSSKQVAVLAYEYVNAVKIYHKETITSYENLSYLESLNIKDFLSNFIPNAYNFTLEEILKSKIDNYLVEDFFYSIIYSEKTITPWLYSFLYKIKFKINQSFKIRKSSTCCVDIPNSYYIYPNEDEEHNRFAILYNCFSFMENILEEALIKTIFILSYYSNEKYRTTYTQH